MASEETTFGCGQFLPGYGPFNFPDWGGGGDIVGSGGGGNEEPPDECICIIDSVDAPITIITPPTDPDGGGFPGGGLSSVSQTIHMTCAKEGGEGDQAWFDSLVAALEDAGWNVSPGADAGLGIPCEPCPSDACADITLNGWLPHGGAGPGGGGVVIPPGAGGGTFGGGGGGWNPCPGGYPCCNTGAHCPGECETCVGHQCTDVPGTGTTGGCCEVNEDCPENHACEGAPGSQTCVAGPECTASNPCDDVCEHCENEVCVPTFGCCEDTVPDCQQYYMCVDNVCVEDPSFCFGNQDCNPPCQLCDDSTHECYVLPDFGEIGGCCEFNVNCGFPDNPCVRCCPQSGQLGGQPCVTDTCIDISQPPLNINCCNEDTDCDEGDVCENNACVPSEEMGYSWGGSCQAGGFLCIEQPIAIAEWPTLEECEADMCDCQGQYGGVCCNDPHCTGLAATFGGGETRQDTPGGGLVGKGTSKLGKSRKPSGIFRNVLKAGSALLRSSSPSRKLFTQEARKKKSVNLNNPQINTYLKKSRPTGFIDEDIAIFTRANPERVPNTTGNDDLFAPVIDNNINYIMKNNFINHDWDSSRITGITTKSVMRSLKRKVWGMLKSIKNYDGSFLSDKQIFNIIGTRIVDGTINKIQVRHLLELAKESAKRDSTKITKGANPIVNDYASLALIENNYFSLDPKKSSGIMRKVLPNWKVLSTDIAKHITINVNGKVYKFYIKDDDTFITGSALKIQDGDFFRFTRFGKTYKIFCRSEMDHAFLVPEGVRQKVIPLLGGDNSGKLSATAPAASGIEYNYSLSSPRQNYYVLSAVLSSVITEPTHVGSDLLKTTTLTYKLMDTSSASGLQAVNDYIRYKANNKTVMMADDDLLLDYMERTGELKWEQQDIIPNIPKTNKSIPLLLRQIPWYMIVYPTNKIENLLFNGRSKIISYEPSGNITREDTFLPVINPPFDKKRTHQFVYQRTAFPNYANVLGEWDSQARISVIDSDNTLFQTGYRKSGNVGSAERLAPRRPKTGLRLMYEIIKELNTNYVIASDSTGKSLTEFDLFSRFKLTQFNKLITLENKKLLINLVRNGLIENVKVFPAIRRASKQISIRKTQLVQKRSTAGPTNFPTIKTMATGFDIEAPTSTEKGPSSGFSPVNPRIRT